MKNLIAMLLAVLTAASSLFAASDTLTITSHRVINTCSGEQRWLISAYIGEVYESDSLMSFDITIGYDTTLLRPTDGLFSGTLAEQMKFADISPAVNFRVPGEMRVSGFTITRNVKGNLPLFALAGDFKGRCRDTDTLTLPWIPEFNEEFKTRMKVFTTAAVQGKPTPNINEQQGVTHEQEELFFTNHDSVTTTATTIFLSSNLGEQASVTYTVGKARLVSITDFRSTLQAVDTVFSDDSTKLILTFKARSQEDTVYLTLSSTTSQTVQTDTLLSEIAVHDTCSCSTPKRKGKTVLRIDRVPVSVWTDFNEDPATLVRIHPDYITVQSVHGGPQKVRISDIFGRLFAEYVLDDHQQMTIPTASLSSGVYLVTVSTSQRLSSQLFQR